MDSQRARDHLLRLITGYTVSQAIHCVAELGIAEHLADGDKDVVRLGELTGASVPHLQRVLYALSTIGLFNEVGGKYRLTPLSAPLRREAPDSVWSIASFHGRETYKGLGELLHTVRTGGAAWDHAYGLSLWEYLRANPDRARTYDDTMSAFYNSELLVIAEAYGFSQFRSIVDIGGGNGSVLATILRRYTGMTGVLFDQPDVVTRAEGAFRADESLRGRYRLEGGNCFDRVPTGSELYMLRYVIHDWDDQSAAQILRTCRTAMSKDSRLLLIERILGDHNRDAVTAWMDISMMMFGGKERTVAEYEALLAGAGLAVTRVITTPSCVSIIESRRLANADVPI
jgi:hypothetical protein